MDVDALPSALQRRKALEAAERSWQTLGNDKIADMAGDEQPTGTSGLDDKPIPLSNLLWSQAEEGAPAFWQYLEKGTKNLRNLVGSEEKVRRPDVVSWTVVLSRTRQSKAKWGFAWDKYKFFAMEQRVVEKLQPGSIAAQWNQKAEASDRADMCVLAGDRLISANGRTEVREIAAALEGDEVVLEFERLMSASSAMPPKTPSRNVQTDGVVAPKAAPQDRNVAKVVSSPQASELKREVDAEINLGQERSVALPNQTMNSMPSRCHPVPVTKSPVKATDLAASPAEQEQRVVSARPLSISLPRPSSLQGVGLGAPRSLSSEADTLNTIEVGRYMNLAGDNGDIESEDEDEIHEDTAISSDVNQQVSPEDTVISSDVTSVAPLVESPPDVGYQALHLPTSAELTSVVSSQVPPEPSVPEFDLLVKLEEGRTDILTFDLNANIEELVDEFITRIHLNAIFKEPLLAHANLMVQSFKQTDEVDVADLL